jgi:hypothetical protein
VLSDTAVVCFGTALELWEDPNLEVWSLLTVATNQQHALHVATSLK